jgi:CheY-like chemotaxis protein/HPt (histidine-containing phosphotransfer) domain-containing protein
LRVLIVDDVDANRRLVLALLRSFGHAAETANSGLEAIALAATRRFDVVLMDVQMPDMDGMDAARRIRAQLGAASPWIIAVTANSTPGDRERCLAAGMDDFLTKPIQHQALRAAIEGSGAIDWRRIESLKPFDPDGSMVAGVIASFLGDAPGRIAAIRGAQAAGDAAGLAAAAHALKGAAANIGAERLQDRLTGIEMLAREGRPQEARKAVDALEESLADARAALGTGKTSRGS